jgi:hypothetical protein
MKEGLYFLLVILVLLFIVWYVQKQQREGFQAQENPEPKASEGFQAQENPGPKPPELAIPLVSPRYQTLVEGEAAPFAPPSTSLLAPPPGQAASINSRPAEDPALKKSTEGRIQSVLESIKGFLEREAPGLSQLGDPTVQLPLSTGRSDATRLQSEMEVLRRNPGLPSSLTEEDVNGIESNLGYLQNKWRQSANAFSGSPMPPAEGFTSGGSKKGMFSWLFDWGNYEGFQTSGTGTGTPAAPKQVLAMINNNFNFNTADITLTDQGFKKQTTTASPSVFLVSKRTNNYLETAFTIPTGHTGVYRFIFTNSSTNIDTTTLNINTFDSVGVNISGLDMYPYAYKTGNTSITEGFKLESSRAGTFKLIYNNGKLLLDDVELKIPASAGVSVRGSAHMIIMMTNAANTYVIDNFTITPPAGSASSTAATDPNKPTLKEIKDLNLKISTEILRLEASASTDLNTLGRINKLRDIKNAISDIIEEIELGKRTLDEVPLTKEGIRAFLPIIENQNTAIPELIEENSLTNILNSLFPKFNTGDSDGAKDSQALFKTYADTFLNNLSWDVGLHYKGKAEQDIAKHQADAMRDAKLAAEWSPTGKGEAGKSTPASVSNDQATNYRGFLQDLVTNMTGGNEVTSKVSVNGDDGSAAAEASKAKAAPGLDWKKRSAAICDQIRARGYKPSDFGCLENPDKVSAGFSWRGYSRMVCNRLSTVYDPGIPELCGCPPPTWAGWRA